MAKRAAGKIAKKFGGKVEIPYQPFWETVIPAGMATPAPPLGTDLGARGINVAQFCKQFNQMTEQIKPGVPLPTVVNIKPDRTFGIELRVPEAKWFLMQAAGIRMVPEKYKYGDPPAGRISLKHIYHIAEQRHRDPDFEGVPLYETCQLLIREAQTMGIEVHKQLDVNEHQMFQEQRKEAVDAELRAIEEAKTAAVLRTDVISK